MAENKLCSSCKKQIANLKGSVIIMCPNCGKFEIVRCMQCRKLAAKYRCPECGFEGPN